MRNAIIILSVALAAGCVSASAQTPGAGNKTMERPPIIGVAHIGLKTKDMAAARGFYGHDLGFQEPFTLDKPSGGLMLTYFKVNDHQYIEVFPELKSEDEDRLSHIAFETTNIQQLRDYLAAHDVKVPAVLKPGLDGNVSMMLKDPDGHNVEFVQYMPGSLHSANFGKFLPATRISHPACAASRKSAASAASLSGIARRAGTHVTPPDQFVHAASIDISW